MSQVPDQGGVSMRAIALLLALLPIAAQAGVVDAINGVRLRGCRGVAAASSGLRESSRLDEAARRLASGESLQDSARNAGYRAVTSASFHITNVADDRAVEQFVARRFCAQISDRSARDIGVYRRGADVWLLIAAPFAPPPPRAREQVSRRVLELTNQARAQARRCGTVAFAAAPPLDLAPLLERAAAEHSRDMAMHDVLDHIGHDGSTPPERVTRTGYKWRTVGENLASGIMTPEEVVSGWVGSPHHCENLMSPKFRQMGVAYAVNPASAGGIFWTQVFGTPP